MERNEPVYILWTGGWDSTFRVVELSLKNQTIQPLYCVDKNRKSIDKEIEAMRGILDTLRKKEKTSAEILDVEMINIESLPSNANISAAFLSICERVHLGSQYEWLAKLAEVYPMLEIGVEKPSGEYSGIVTAINQSGRLINKNDTWIVDQSVSSKDICTVFGKMSFPIVNTTEKEMQEYIKTIGYEDVMRRIWFCHNPIENEPCGFCRPCQQKMECKMEWLLPERSQRRYKKYRNIKTVLGEKMSDKIMDRMYR